MPPLYKDRRIRITPLSCGATILHPYLRKSSGYRCVGWQYSIRIWETGEWQTRTAECRQRSASPLPRKQMVAGLAAKEAGRNAQPSLMYMCSGAGNGTRTRDPLLGNQMHTQRAAARGPQFADHARKPGALKKHGSGRTRPPRWLCTMNRLERGTGFEPATSCLEGLCPLR